MACIKCGGPTKDGETLCETCTGEGGLIPPVEETTPQKPKKTKRAVLALTAVFVVLVGIFAVGKLFFNRDFMELIQGKTRYAQNIELATAKSSANQLVSFLDRSVALFQGYSKQKSAESSFGINVKVENAFLKNANLPEEEAKAVQYLNSLKMTGKTLTDDKGVQASLTLTDPSALNLTANLLAYRDGSSYFQFPQITKKYLSAKAQTDSSQFSPYDLAKIKIEPDKLQKSLEKLASIYSGCLSDAKMEAENNQSITVDGTTVQGQKLTASLTAAQTAAMVKSIANAAKNDGDLYAFVSDNYSLFSKAAGASTGTAPEKLTKESYGKLIDNFLAQLNMEKDGVTFSAISYLSQNGTLLAHCYESEDKESKVQLNYILADRKYTVQALIDGKNGFTFSNMKTDEQTGKLQLKIHSGEGPKNIGVDVAYSGLRTVPFMGTETSVGKYVFSVYDPDREISKYIQAEGLSSISSQLDKLSLTLETVPDGDKLKSTFQFSLPGILSISMTGKTGSSAGTASLPPRPGSDQVLDLTGAQSEKAMNELYAGAIIFLSDTLKKDSELVSVLEISGMSPEQLHMLADFYKAYQFE